MVIFLWIFVFGILTGFRALLPTAQLSFAAWQKDLPLKGSKLAIMGNPIVMVVLILLALVEIWYDKRRTTPNRTLPSSLAVRSAMGALGGAVLAASALLPLWKGSLVGALGALLGAVIGYSMRQFFVDAFRCKDFYVAVGEDILTVIGTQWVLSQFLG
jgi:uncharacterized membrane protein